ncbi:MAG: hypothetical protein ABI647_21675 [Gemmatimonadota bacterium]
MDLTQADFFAGRFHRPPMEAKAVLAYVQDTLGAPPPVGVGLPSDLVGPLVDMAGQLAGYNDRRQPQPGAWLAMAQRVGDLLR